MKLTIQLMFGFIVVMSTFVYCSEYCPTQLDLQNPKNRTVTLDSFFIKNIAHMFGATVFIETGTFCGATARAAAPFFDEVHTVELHHGLYVRSLYNLSDQQNVRVYHGDSSVILPAILQNVRGVPLFWLDGHWNGDAITGCGNKTTPILEELAAIKQSGIKNGILLIDDLRAFEQTHEEERAFLSDYPTIHNVRETILDINPDYCMCVIGDMLLAYPNVYDIEQTPLVIAITKSRFFDRHTDDVQEIIYIEKEIIAHASDADMAIVKGMFEDFCPHKLGKDYALWYGLMLLHRGFAHEASSCFTIAIDISKRHECDHWRLHWYKAQADIACNNYQQAEIEMKMAFA